MSPWGWGGGVQYTWIEQGDEVEFDNRGRNVVKEANDEEKRGLRVATGEASYQR